MITSVENVIYVAKHENKKNSVKTMGLQSVNISDEDNEREQW